MQKRLKEHAVRILNLEKETNELKQDNIILKNNYDKLTKKDK